MRKNRVNHNSNKFPEDSEMGYNWGEVLCSIYNCVEQLFTITLEQQPYGRIYMIRITRIGSTWPRIVCYWNTSEVKEGKLKIHYERENKEIQTVQFNKVKKT